MITGELMEMSDACLSGLHPHPLDLDTGIIVSKAMAVISLDTGRDCGAMLRVWKP